MMKTPVEFKSNTQFSHVKPGDTQFLPGGLRDFFLYRDLGVAKATNGKVIAHLVKANKPPVNGTGWHYHVAEFQIVVMTKGWARFMLKTSQPWLRPEMWCIRCPVLFIIFMTTLQIWNTWRLLGQQTLVQYQWRWALRRFLE